jgi:hypothetical protein
MSGRSVTILNTRKDNILESVVTFFARPKKVTKERTPKSQRHESAHTLAIISVRQRSPIRYRECACTEIKHTPQVATAQLPAAGGPPPISVAYALWS